MTVQINGDTGVSLVQDNTIQTADIVNGAVTADKLAAGSTGTAAPQKMMLMAVKNASGTVVDFSPADGTGIPSWAKKITVSLRGVSTSGTSLPLLRLGSSSTVQTSGYLGAAGNVFNGPSITTVNQTAGCALAAAWAATSTVRGHVVLTHVGGNAWVASGQLGGSDNSSCMLFTSDLSLSGVLDTLRITTVNGTDTFDAGSVSLLIEG